MNEILANALKCIEIENEKFDKSFELVDLVVQEYGEENLADRLYNEIDSSIHWKVVADLYAILIWSTSDNGSKLTCATDRWISECEEERKIQIALHLDTYPFLNGREMVEKLNKVAAKFPSVSDKCIKLINSRAEQNA